MVLSVKRLLPYQAKVNDIAGLQIMVIVAFLFTAIAKKWSIVPSWSEIVLKQQCQYLELKIVTGNYMHWMFYLVCISSCIKGQFYADQFVEVATVGRVENI